MNPSIRDRISVDLYGLRAALFERARANGVSPPEYVRRAVSAALGEVPREDAVTSLGQRSGARVRLSLRLDQADAALLMEAARGAGLSPSALVAQLVAGVPHLMSADRRSNAVEALHVSTVELSRFGRDLRQLTAQLRQGDGDLTGAHQATLDGLSTGIYRHLAAASLALKGLRSNRAGNDRRPRQGDGRGAHDVQARP